MVVLEPLPSTEEENTHTNVEPKPSTTIDSVTVDSSNDVKTTTGYTSDGYETASETEINDEDVVVVGNIEKDSNDVVECEQQQQPECDQEQKSVQSYEDALNDDEFKRKILAQMNEAKVEGNKLFGDGQYEEALLKYDFALQLAPEMPSSAEIRSICHANRATCFFKLGKFEDTIKECTKSLELNPTYMKAMLRRGEAHEKLENYDEAIGDLKKIVELDPSNYQAKRTIVRLEPLAVAKREKMKEEMIGKLKDMGNSLLGRFGMSVDNFKAVKDPSTGSYSISFQR